MGAPAIAADFPRRRFTVDEVYQMLDDGILREDEQLELLDGELVVMSPQGALHAACVAEIQLRLAAAYGTAAHVRTQLPIDARPYNLPEPDLAVVRGKPLDYRDSHPTGRDIVLAVEIANTSQDLDHRKSVIYAAAGVPTYWLVDLSQRCVEVFSQLTAGIGGERTYGQHVVLDASQRVPLPDLAVTWSVADLVT